MQASAGALPAAPMQAHLHAAPRPLARIASTRGVGGSRSTSCRRRRHAAAAASSSSSPPSSASPAPPPPPPPPLLRQPPLPPSFPVLQHVPALLSSVARHGSIEPLLYEWATTVGRDSGGTVQWRVPGAPAVALVSDPDAVKAIFERGRWPKSPLYKDLEPLLGAQSLVLTEGSEWRAQRDAYNPAFGGAFLRAAYDGFVAAAEELVAALDEAAEAGAKGAGAEEGGARAGAAGGGGAPGAADDPPGVVRVWELVVLATVEIIFRVGFGEARGLLSRADRNPLADPLYRAFYDLGTHVSWFLDNVPLNRLKNLPWNVSKTRRLRDELERQLGRVLDGRVEAMRRSGALPEGVEVVDGAMAATAAGSSSACPFAGLAGAMGGVGGGAGGAGGDAQAAVAAATVAAADGGGAATEEGGGAAAAEAAAAAAAEQEEAATLLEDDQMSLGSGASPVPPLSPSSSPRAAAAASSSSPSSSPSRSPSPQPPPAAASDILSMAVATLVASGATAIDRAALLSQQATLFAAGHDTTAGAISWAVYFLSRDAPRRARLVAELDAVFEARRRQGQELRRRQQEQEEEGGGGGEAGAAAADAGAGTSAAPAAAADIPSWEELSSMPYLTAVIKETLRFRPPVGIIARACPVPAPSSSAADKDAAAALAPRSADDPERGAVRGVDLRGKIAVVSPYVLHRLERYWGADAGEWVPERWLENEGEPVAPGGPPPRPARALSVPQYAFLPFSRGERDCIGSRFATIEAKVILAALFRRFEFEWAGSAGGERVRMALTAHPAERVPMHVSRRRRVVVPSAGEDDDDSPGEQAAAQAVAVGGVAAR